MQDGYSKVELEMLLEKDWRIELYCIHCDSRRDAGPHEREQIRRLLNKIGKASIASDIKKTEDK